MTERTPVEATNLDGYGNPAFPWDDVRKVLALPIGMEAPAYLGTVNPNGRPHSNGIGPCWLDGDFYITGSLNSQKMKNLAVNPSATLSIRLPGYDVTLDGVTSRVDDLATLEKVAAIYRADGWPAEVAGDALTAPYSAQTAGPPPWHVFRFRFTKVIALRLSESGGAMRWRFED
jgi:hypothetical protein